MLRILWLSTCGSGQTADKLTTDYLPDSGYYTDRVVDDDVTGKLMTLNAVKQRPPTARGLVFITNIYFPSLRPVHEIGRRPKCSAGV